MIQESVRVSTHKEGSSAHDGWQCQVWGSITQDSLSSFSLEFESYFWVAGMGRQVGKSQRLAEQLVSLAEVVSTRLSDLTVVVKKR